MCASDVYLLRGEANELLMKDVAEIRVEGDALRLVDLLGNERTVSGHIVRLDLEGHAIYVAQDDD